MKIKIIKVVEDKPVYAPEGKKYKVYCKVCDMVVEGRNGRAEVKSFTDKINDTIKDGVELEAEKDIYQGKTSFKIKAEKKDWNGKGGYQQRHQYNEKEFIDLWAFAQMQTKTDTQLDTFFRCATASGIVVSGNEQSKKPEPKKSESDKDKQIDKAIDTQFDLSDEAPFGEEKE